jgi:hypothetical protein
MLRNAPDDQARVLVVDRAAGITDVARQVIARRNAQRDRRAALAAVLQGVRRGYGRGPWLVDRPAGAAARSAARDT